MCFPAVNDYRKGNFLMKETNINNLVFRLSLLLTGGIALWAVASNKSFTIVSDAIYNFLTK